VGKSGMTLCQASFLERFLGILGLAYRDGSVPGTKNKGNNTKIRPLNYTEIISKTIFSHQLPLFTTHSTIYSLPIHSNQRFLKSHLGTISTQTPFYTGYLEWDIVRFIVSGISNYG
jgi:hypothetical protein